MTYCDSNCHYSLHRYCISATRRMMPLFIDGPNGRNQYGMRCADYAVIDKSEVKTYQTKEEAI